MLETVQVLQIARIDWKLLNYKTFSRSAVMLAKLPENWQTYQNHDAKTHRMMQKISKMIHNKPD